MLLMIHAVDRGEESKRAPLFVYFSSNRPVSRVEEGGHMLLLIHVVEGGRDYKGAPRLHFCFLVEPPS